MISAGATTAPMVTGGPSRPRPLPPPGAACGRRYNVLRGARGPRASPLAAAPRAPRVPRARSIGSWAARALGLRPSGLGLRPSGPFPPSPLRLLPFPPRAPPSARPRPRPSLRRPRAAAAVRRRPRLRLLAVAPPTDQIARPQRGRARRGARRVSRNLPAFPLFPTSAPPPTARLSRAPKAEIRFAAGAFLRLRLDETAFLRLQLIECIASAAPPGRAREAPRDVGVASIDAPMRMAARRGPRCASVALGAGCRARDLRGSFVCSPP